MATMRAKMKIESVTRTQYGEKLRFSAVYGGSTNAEDNTFASATPNATFEMDISNKELHGKFNPGDTFYVDFAPADVPKSE